MASRRLEDLHPDLMPLCKEHIAQCQHEGIDIIITCTFRSPEEQNRLYGQGRTSPGAIVTNAKGGQSAHNYMLPNGKFASKAYDVVPLRGGKCIWGTKGHDGEIWKKVGEIGMNLGLNWYGAPGSKFLEYAHFQLKE